MGDTHPVQRTEIDGITLYRFESLAEQGVTHALLTRLGGVSRPPFASLNLGHTVGDELAAVEENHRRVYHALGLSRSQVVSPYQVHGNHVRLVGAGHGGTTQPASDGLLTTTPGVALLLRFADCVPLLLFDPRRRALAVVHAGWKGTAAGIAPQAVAAFVRGGSRAGDLWAGIGPAIGPCCFQVGQDTADRIAAACPGGADVAERRKGALFLDLPAAVRSQLQAAGVNHVERAGLCTACHTGEWFSHRAEDGRTGRFGVLVMLD